MHWVARGVKNTILSTQIVQGVYAGERCQGARSLSCEHRSSDEKPDPPAFFQRCGSRVPALSALPPRVVYARSRCGSLQEHQRYLRASRGRSRFAKPVTGGAGAETYTGYIWPLGWGRIRIAAARDKPGAGKNRRGTNPEYLGADHFYGWGQINPFDGQHRCGGSRTTGSVF